MKCDAIKQLLSEGQPLTGAAQHHLASCVGCRGMMQALTLPEAEPDGKHLSQIQSLITASLKPVRPLPSNRTLVWTLLIVFTAFSLVAAIPVGYKGFHVLNGYERFAYYGLIFMAAAWFSIATVQEMIPGSKRRTSPSWTILTTMLSLAILVSVLFQNFDLV